jgi:hypothetical protein
MTSFGWKKKREAVKNSTSLSAFQESEQVVVRFPYLGKVPKFMYLSNEVQQTKL